MPIAAALPFIAAGVTAGASIYSANKQSKAAGKSAAASQAATDQAVAENRRQFDITQANQLPWQDAGKAALGRLQDPNAFQASPDYAFRQSEGQKQVDSNYATKGLLKSGSALKALNNYAQNTASGEYGAWWQRQSGLAGVGQAANAAVQTSGQQTTNNITNAVTNNADNLATSYGAKAGAATGLAGNLAGTALWGLNQVNNPGAANAFAKPAAPVDPFKTAGIY